MNTMKSGQLIALMAGMILLAVLGFNIATVQAHGHGGGHGGHGGGHGGGHHHGEHPHEHWNHGSGNDSHYRHDHDDYGDHRHDCRPKKGAVTDAIDVNEECQNHNGEWEPSMGD